MRTQMISIPLKSKTAKVIEIRRLMNNAIRNMQRQRRKEQERREVRVRSAFWEQAAYDYRRQLEPLVKSLLDMGVVI